MSAKKYVEKTSTRSVYLTIEEGYNDLDDLLSQLKHLNEFISSRIDYIQTAKERRCDMVYIHVNDTSLSAAGCSLQVFKEEIITSEND